MNDKILSFEEAKEHFTYSEFFPFIETESDAFIGVGHIDEQDFIDAIRTYLSLSVAPESIVVEHRWGIPAWSEEYNEAYMERAEPFYHGAIPITVVEEIYQ